MELGKINKLTVNRLVDFGAYLDAGNGAEVLLPRRYITAPLAPGDEVEVMVYTDSEDRPVATTDTPVAQAGEFAFLNVVAVTKVGAFLDWGLPKDLLVPFSEQKSRMKEGGNYLVYVFVDNASGRVAATARIEKYLGNTYPDYTRGQKVDCLVFERNDLGYRCIVDNAHPGIIYENEVYTPLERGQRVEGYVRQVRPDGKIDIYLGGRADVRTEALARRILAAIKTNGGTLRLSDKSSPDEIAAMFSCSKKDFKKAVGHLLKAKKITLGDDKTALFAAK